jgi:hypothetical protein
MELQQGYTNATGRQITFNDNDYENIAATSQILGKEGAQDYFAKLQNFGLSIEDASKRAGKMAETATKNGLSLETLSKNIRDNIGIAQRYTFRNGLRGLESMAKKATEIGLNMSQAASFAEKVNTVEGAVRTGAQLQVLGGPFAQMADPIGMLYEGLNDLEGLQDRMVQMFGNLGTFNKQTGEVDISSFNRVRIKEAAKAMGIDDSNLFESINSSARRNEIERQLSGNTNISKETADLIKNIGKIQNGVAGVDINGEFVEASKLTNNDTKYLEEIARSESDDVKNIAIRLRGWEDSVQGFSKQRDAIHGQMIETSGIGKGVQSIINNVGDIKKILVTLAALKVAGGVIGALGGAFMMAKGGARIATKGIPNLFTGKLRTSGSAPQGNVTPGTSAAHYVNPKTNKAYRWEGGFKKGRLVNAGTQRTVTRGAFGYDKLARAAKIGKVSSVVAKGASIASIAGVVGELGMDAYIGKNQNRKGKWEDYAGNIASSALSGAGTGAMIGAIVPSVGPIVGAVIGGIGGAISGGIKARKHQLERPVSEAGVELYGSYSKKELKQIRNAARGEGTISVNLMEKMKMQGDSLAIEQLQNIANSVIANGSVKTTIVGAQKKETGGIIQGPTKTGDKVPVMTNAGEMILNQGQQATLWGAIKTGDFNKVTKANPSIDMGTYGLGKNGGINPSLPSLSPAPEVNVSSPSVVIATPANNIGNVVPSTTKTNSIILPNKQGGNQTTTIVPRQTEDAITTPVPQTEKTVKFELSGEWNINIGGNINAVTPDGQSKKVDIDVHEIKKLIEQTLATKINQELARMDSGGRIVNNKAFFHQLSDN